MSNINEVRMSGYRRADRSSRTGVTMQVAEFIDAIRNPAEFHWGDEPQSLAELLAGYRELLPNPQAAKEYKRSNLPAVSVSGYYAGGRSGMPQAHSGLVQIDLDDIHDPRQSAQIIDKLAELSFVAWAYQSPSYSVKAAARVRLPEDYADHRHVFTVANRTVTELLGLPSRAYDQQVSAPNALCYLSADSEIYYRPNAAVLPVPAYEAPPKPKPQRELDDSDIAYSDKLAALDAIDSPRSDPQWTRKVAGALDAGIDDWDVLAWVHHQNAIHGKGDMKDTQWRSIVRSIQDGPSNSDIRPATKRSFYRAALDAGWQWPKRYAEPEPEIINLGIGRRTRKHTEE